MGVVVHHVPGCVGVEVCWGCHQWAVGWVTVPSLGAVYGAMPGSSSDSHEARFSPPQRAWLHSTWLPTEAPVFLSWCGSPWRLPIAQMTLRWSHHGEAGSCGALGKRMSAGWQRAGSQGGRPRTPCRPHGSRSPSCRRCGPRLSAEAAEKLKNRYVIMRSGARQHERDSDRRSSIPITVR